MKSDRPSRPPQMRTASGGATIRDVPGQDPTKLIDVRQARSAVARAEAIRADVGLQDVEVRWLFDMVESAFARIEDLERVAIEEHLRTVALLENARQMALTRIAPSVDLDATGRAVPTPTKPPWPPD